MFDEEKRNYYEILDILPDASQSDIRQAYFRAKAAYGRDSAAIYSLFDSIETKNLLERIEEAYLVLSNQERRKEYDKTHGFLQYVGKHSPSSPPPPPKAAKPTFSFASSQSTSTVPEEAKPVEQKRESLPTQYTGDDSKLTVSPSPGHMRRIDLIKPYNTDPTMEDSIRDEQDFRGSFLKRIREYKGISIEELSDFTKISKTYLSCIESEEFDSLPAPAYLRGFITQFAKALKLPHDKVASGYMKHYRSVVGQ